MVRNDEQGKQKNKANEVRNPDDNESRYKIKNEINKNNSHKYLGVSSKIQQDSLLSI